MVSANGFRGVALGLGILLLAVAIPAAHASIIDIDSNGGPDEFNVVPGQLEAPDVAITASPVWAPAGTGYEWVSYGATGCNTFVVLTGTCTPGPENPPAVVGNITLSDGGPVLPTAFFYNQFTLPAGDTYTGTLTVWADDTARIYLDGNLLIDANPILGGNCANAPVGCTQLTGYTIDLSTLNFLTGGINTLEIDAYQLAGGTPFGVMYNGFVDAEPGTTPEPASYVLMGLGLAAIGILIPRVRRA